MVNKRKLLLFHNRRDNKNYLSRRIVVALLEANKIHTIKCGIVILSRIFEGVSEKPPKKQFQFIILKLLNRGRTAEKKGIWMTFLPHTKYLPRILNIFHPRLRLQKINKRYVIWQVIAKLLCAKKPSGDALLQKAKSSIIVNFYSSHSLTWGLIVAVFSEYGVWHLWNSFLPNFAS